MTALQCPAGFCCTSTAISPRCTYVPSLLNLPPTSHPIPPLWGVTEHQVELPALHSNFPLAIYFTYACMHVKSLQSCPTLCDPMDGSPPGSSVHWILQARILEWIDTLSSKESSQLREGTHCLLCLLHWQGRFFTTKATWEAQPSLVPHLLSTFEMNLKDLMCLNTCHLAPSQGCRQD